MPNFLNANTNLFQPFRNGRQSQVAGYNLLNNEGKEALTFMQNEIFDHRLNRAIEFYTKHDKNSTDTDVTRYLSVPYLSSDSYVFDFHETPKAIELQIAEIEEDISKLKGEKGEDNTAAINALTEKKVILNQKLLFVMDRTSLPNRTKYSAFRSMIHPYALIKLTGAYGEYGKKSEIKVTGHGGYTKDYEPYLIDSRLRRKWYEVDGDEYGGYAKTPTTNKIIEWGNSNKKGVTPYSFQDFVFCKYWNKIENNRMITLRRYSVPIYDNLIMPMYESNENGSTSASNTGNEGDKYVTPGVKYSDKYLAPLVTAITYFGEGTENSLSDILSFSYNYNWDKLESQEHPIDVSSVQLDEGNVFGSGAPSSLSRGLQVYSHLLGILNDIKGTPTSPDARYGAGMPPDPYSTGPYENRIIGPVNVITDTYKRKRGLTFTHDGLKLTFEYVARPIAGVNTKAVMLDLLSNMLLMGYATGSWFGGMWRYNAQNIAMYPWMDQNSMNKVYQGKLFGKNGALRSFTEKAYGENGDFLKRFVKGFFEEVQQKAEALFNSIFNRGDGGGGGGSTSSTQSTTTSATTRVWTAAQKHMSRRLMQGASIPYMNNMKALLTGDAVGEWHLTIGNPLNPIAMIGNLIVTNSSITFNNELGPDDFPTGFKCVIELKHALGRDREAIESMFNRGNGRIYTLGAKYRSYADGQTVVDDETRKDNFDPYGYEESVYKETFAEHFGGGTRYIMKKEVHDLNNNGAVKSSEAYKLNQYDFLKPSKDSNGITFTPQGRGAIYRISETQLSHIL